MLEELPEGILGSKDNPVRSIYDLYKAIKGRRNCYVYIVDSYPICKQILEELQNRNIILIGENYLKLHKKIENTILYGITDLIPKGILVDILKGQDIRKSTSFKPNNLTKKKINREFKFDELHELEVPDYIENIFRR